MVMSRAYEIIEHSHDVVIVAPAARVAGWRRPRPARLPAGPPAAAVERGLLDPAKGARVL